MDEAHLLAAFRYVALNPVKARLVASPGDWPWSSARAHLRGEDDGLVRVQPLLERVDQVADFFDDSPDPALVAALTKGQSVGRPLMGDHALGELEKRLGRRLRPRKRGRPPSPKNDAGQTQIG
jgi:putative transposase